MTSHLAVFVLGGLVAAAITVSLPPKGLISPDPIPPAGDQRPARPARDRALEVPAAPGPHLAFDVRPRDYAKTTRYRLEVKHPDGTTTSHDLEKPRLQRRTIVIAVPPLPPGSYQLVVIAEIAGGAKTRSEAFALEIPGE